MVLKKTLKRPLDCKEIKLNLLGLTLKEINPEYSLEGLMLKLNLQHFGHLMQRTDSLEKTLMLGGAGRGLKARGKGDSRGCDGWIAS